MRNWKKLQQKMKLIILKKFKDMCRDGSNVFDAKRTKTCYRNKQCFQSSQMSK